MSWAMPSARATHPSGRSLLRVSALCVGIAIASCNRLPASQQEITAFEYMRLVDAAQGDEARMAEARRMLADGKITEPELSQFSDFIDHQEDIREEHTKRFYKRVIAASGTSGSAQDAKRLDPKGAGPTREGGDAQGRSS